MVKIFNRRRILIALLLVIITYGSFYFILPERLMSFHIRSGLLPAIVFISFDITCITFSVLLIWSLNNRFVKWLDIKAKWENDPFRRMFFQVVGISIIDALILISTMSVAAFLSWLLYPSILRQIKLEELKALFMQPIIYFVVTMGIYHFVYISVFFYKRWVKSLLESERLKNDNLHAQLHTLQNQVNPHFLFNSLNTLTTLISEDKNTAIEFVQRLSNFYRYLLQRQTVHFVPLADELNFVDSYIYLQTKRFGANLNIEIDLSSDIRNKLIPTFVLQILLENAIKHNIVSSEKPLVVKIYSEDESSLCVSNNLQKKNIASPSTGQGLDNIMSRYDILSGKNIEVIETDDSFKVIIPLMDERGSHESLNY